MTTGEGRQPVKSAGRALDVLEALAAASAPRSLVELARALDIPKSSLHGLLRTLADRGWVTADRTGTRFGLGVRALQVGAAYLAADEATGLLGPVLDQLSARFGETVQLERLDGDAVVLLARRDSPHPLRPHCPLGRRSPAHATAAGKALLAVRGDRAVDRLLNWPLAAPTRHTVTDPAELHAQLAAARRQGWAVDREESCAGLLALAVAVPLREPAVDAISLVLPTSRTGPEVEARMVAALLAAGAQIRTARALLGC